MRSHRTAITLVLAFCFGGGSAEVAVRTHRAIVRRQLEAQEVGSAGHLVELTLRSPGGEVIASPRLIAPPGKRAKLVLVDPANPENVKLMLDLQAEREPDGDVEIAYELALPSRDLVSSGHVHLTPGEEKPVDLPRDDVVASFLAVPVPSKAFDAYLEAERPPKDAI